MLWRHLGDVLHALLSRYAQPARAWLAAALSAPQLEALGTPLGAREKEAFGTAAFALAAEPRQKRKFTMLVKDFCKICRGQMDADALQGHLVVG